MGRAGDYKIRTTAFLDQIAAAMRDTLPRTAEHEDIEDTMWLDYRKVDWLELLSEEPPVEDRPA